MSPHRSRSSVRLAATLSGLLLVTACSGAPATPTSPDAGGDAAPRVTTDFGDLVGQRDDDVVRFRGVPYAEPPVGDLRLAPPEPLEAWDGTLDATASGPACVQDDWQGGLLGDEDCLLVDVTAPASASDGPRPVMVWFHGGGLEQGAGSDHDPRRLAVEGDVVVVTVGSRLGALGLLAVPGLEGGGTFALADQLEALRFVRETADAFGGDPDNVTAFGESGGATALCHLLASPDADGLFDRAILQSAVDCGAPAPPNAYALPFEGSDELEPSWPPVADVEARSVAAAATIGCSQDDDEARIACLRDLPAEDLLPIHRDFTSPAIGSTLVPERPIDALDEVDVPVLTGFTRHESRFFPILAALLGTPYGPGTYEPAIEDSFGDRAAAILETYPREDHADDSEAWAAVYTDRTFACPQVHANDVLSRSTEVYAYEFADGTAPPPLPLLEGAPEPAAAHSTELPYLFEVAGQPLDIEGNRIPLTESQQQVASRMIEVWTDFARTGQAPVEPWTPGGASLVFGPDAVEVGDPTETHRCGFWDLEAELAAGEAAP